MEAFAIALYAVGGLVAAPVFCYLVARFAPRAPAIATAAWYASLALLALFVVEYGAVRSMGATTLHARLGVVFVALHSIATLLVAPALACTVLAGRWRTARWWPAVAVLAWAVGVFAILFNYDVFDAINGLDPAGQANS